jgi:hypothetical protein
MFNNPPENRNVCVTVWKNMVDPDRPQMTTKYGACALHAAYLRPYLSTYTHTHEI